MRCPQDEVACSFKISLSFKITLSVLNLHCGWKQLANLHWSEVPVKQYTHYTRHIHKKLHILCMCTWECKSYLKSITDQTKSQPFCETKVWVFHGVRKIKILFCLRLLHMTTLVHSCASPCCYCLTPVGHKVGLLQIISSVNLWSVSKAGVVHRLISILIFWHASFLSSWGSWWRPVWTRCWRWCR